MSEEGYFCAFSFVFLGKDSLYLFFGCSNLPNSLSPVFGCSKPSLFTISTFIFPSSSSSLPLRTPQYSPLTAHLTILLPLPSLLNPLHLLIPLPPISATESNFSSQSH